MACWSACSRPAGITEPDGAQHRHARRECGPGFVRLCTSNSGAAPQPSKSSLASLKIAGGVDLGTRGRDAEAGRKAWRCLPKKWKRGPVLLQQAATACDFTCDGTAGKRSARRCQDLGDSAKVADRVRAVAARMPTYSTLKDVKKRWGQRTEDVSPGGAILKSLGRHDGLAQIGCRFAVVSRRRGQQLKEPAQARRLAARRLGSVTSIHCASGSRGWENVTDTPPIIRQGRSGTTWLMSLLASDRRGLLT